MATIAGRFHRSWLARKIHIPVWGLILIGLLIIGVLAALFLKGVITGDANASSSGYTPAVDIPVPSSNVQQPPAPAPAAVSASNQPAASKELSALQIIVIEATSKDAVSRALSSNETVILIDNGPTAPAVIARTGKDSPPPRSVVLALGRLNDSISFGKGILERGREFADKDRQVIANDDAFAAYDRFYQNLQLQKKGYLQVEATPTIDENFVREFLARNTDPRQPNLIVDSEQRIPFHVKMTARGVLIYEGDSTLEFRYQKQNPIYSAGPDGNYIILKELTH